MDYESIINLDYRGTTSRQPMPMAARAAQFAPFAALSGHDDAISETARHTSPMIELSDEEKSVLSSRLAILADRISERPPIRITYFQPDPLKDGGCYIRHESTVRKIDGYDATLTLSDGTIIPFIHIYSIDSHIFP